MKELKQKNVEELYIHNRIAFQRAFAKQNKKKKKKKKKKNKKTKKLCYTVLYNFPLSKSISTSGMT